MPDTNKCVGCGTVIEGANECWECAKKRQGGVEGR